MIPFGKVLLAGLVAGTIAALLGYGIASLLIRGDDPERHALGITLILAFFVGTLSCGIAAARIQPAKAFGTALLAALAYEAILLIIARPGLSLRAVAIAFGAAALFALIGALIGIPRKAKP
jgi:hypothetical protein